jgi:hypothetical protein
MLNEGTVRAWLVVAWGVVAGCSSFVARPVPPRQASAGPDTVRIDHFKNDRVALAVRGPHRVTAAGVIPVGASGSVTCVPQAGAALELGPEAHGVKPPPGETLIEARLPGEPLTQALAVPSMLAVQLEGAQPACLQLTLSSLDPEYRWAFPPYDHHLEVGRGLALYVARQDGHRFGGGLEWELAHLGRWVGPLRPTLALRVRAGSDALAVPVGGLVLGYPLIGKRVALGLAAGYDLAPAWSGHFQDGDRFKWTHGPRAELHLTYLAPQLLGLPPAYQTGGAALVVWVGRADAPHYAAEQVGLGLALN